MKRVVTERNRRMAVHALEVCANDRSFMNLLTCTWDVLGRFPRPLEDILADTAFRSVPKVEGGLEVRYLEAAALLRDGWNPGEPVEYRNTAPVRKARA